MGEVVWELDEHCTRWWFAIVDLTKFADYGNSEGREPLQDSVGKCTASSLTVKRLVKLIFRVNTIHLRLGKDCMTLNPFSCFKRTAC